MPSDRLPAPIEPSLRLASLEDVRGDAIRPGAVLDRARIVDVDSVDADLDELALSECVVERWQATGARLRHARIAESRIERLDAATLDASRSAWRDVEIVASRIGSIDLSDASIRSLVLVGCKLGHVNLRAARVRDLTVRDCTVDVLDVGDAELERVAFPGSTVATLELPRARLRHVDLRGLEPRAVSPVAALAGATIDRDQLALLAPAFADHLGIRVVG
ncbi:MULTISPECIES: pentapeptide repeat-containing protein [unclassified Agrococcus]|uniref:pentapeptide repeat-containing protein n=1 Tax=unclassified Agrococcus TaxID=2615065 RepID=UPI0036210BD3